MPVFKIKNKDGSWQEVAGVSGHSHSVSQIVDFPDMNGLATEEYVDSGLATRQPVGDYALKSEIPTDDHINNLITAAAELPTVTTSDSGKFLRVSADGTWAAETIPHIEEVAF
jgi:hypothetical protein